MYPDFDKYGGDQWAGTYSLDATKPLPLATGCTYRQQISFITSTRFGQTGHMDKVYMKIPDDEPK